MDFTLFPSGPGPAGNLGTTGVPPSDPESGNPNPGPPGFLPPQPPQTITHTLEEMNVINQLWSQTFNGAPVPDVIARIPPLYTCLDEMVWHHPSNNGPAYHQLILDTQQETTSSSSSSTSSGTTDCEPEEEEEDDHDLGQDADAAAPHSESPKFSIAVQELFQLALQETLTQAQRQELLDELVSYEADTLIALGLKPDTLTQLITKNPPIAIYILSSLLERGRILPGYLEVLTSGMDISVQTMEVVNGLTGVPNLPKQFLNAYISNCLETIGRSGNKRIARLLCVFLTSLLRTRVIVFQMLPQALYFEILAFCIEYTQIREATSLFRYLKELELEAENTGDVDFELASKISLSDHHDLPPSSSSPHLPPGADGLGLDESED